MFSIEGKNVVVTGGGSGIGKAICTLFAKQGAMVHILEISDDSARQVMQEIAGANGRAKAYACDISKQQQVLAAFDQIKDIDILVNNAGIAHVGKVETTTEQDFDKIVDVNIKGTYNCLYAVIPLMKAKSKGVILNMASIAATLGISDRFAYSMSKGAVVSMTLSVARDYLQHNIRCNCISPARVHTPFVDGFISKNYSGKEAEIFERLSKSQPIGRMGKPEEVAALALYLCSDEAAFITGCDYPIDGGFTRLNN